jgi:Raf kinase inhibitor-like YbhB/YbcL family protein
MVRRAIFAFCVALLLRTPAGAAGLTVDTSAFLDGGALPATDAASADDCGGRNISPPLRISGIPAGARSLAVVVFDIDANAGRGFVHWVAYGIAPALTTLPTGFGSEPRSTYAGGTNDAGTRIYFGPCPPRGDRPHHYVFTVYALDLRPGTLAPGLTRQALLAAIKPHVLASASISGTYGRALTGKITRE